MTERMDEPSGGKSATHRAGDVEDPGDGMDCHFGIRVRANRTWSIYQVFSGVPAELDGNSMIGLGRAIATASMPAMNLRNVARRGARIRLNPPRLDAGEIDVSEWR